MWRTVLLAVLIAIPFLVWTFAPSSRLREIAHDSIRLHLKLFGSSIYEYYEKMGDWPTKSGDLAKTSLPEKSPYWRTMLDDDVNIIVWQADLQPEPRDNADRILVYHNKGLLATRGRSWVCWGDLRTQYIKTDDLRAYLDKLKE